MESKNDDKKKINDDLVVFMRKRSETDAPRYTARLKTFVDIQNKRRRAAVAREHHHEVPRGHHGSMKIPDGEAKSPNRTLASNVGNALPCVSSLCGMYGENPGSEDSRMSRSRRAEEKNIRSRSLSRSGSDDPSDRGCRRRRRRKRCGCRRRKRRRSCRRRRRRSCRRRRRRRRRRSCSRRRRRRSCRRRRRRCRRKRRRC